LKNGTVNSDEQWLSKGGSGGAGLWAHQHTLFCYLKTRFKQKFRPK